MKLTWYGHSAFRADIDGAVILIDPFFTGNPVFEGDVAAISQGVTHIVVTHGHGDHVGDTLAIAQSTGATVITNYDLAMHLASKGLKAFQPVNTGGTIDLGAFSVTWVRADHSAGMGEAGVTVPLGNANGAIIKAKGEKTLWHMGDTDIFSDMALIAEIHGVEACICPVGDRFTMGGAVAAFACRRFFTFDTVVPCHFGTFPMLDANAEKFVEAMAGAPTKVVVPEVAEAFEV